MKHTPGPWKLSIAWKIAARRYRIRWLKAVANNQSLFLSISRRIVELDEQQRINAKLLAALEKAEWGAGTAEGECLCPVCYSANWEGHKQHCRLGAAIAKARGES